MKYYTLLLVMLFCSVSLFAQNDRVSEVEVKEEAQFLDALQLRILERWDDALEAFLALEKKDPFNDVVLFELAKIYWLRKDDLNAATYAKKAIDVNPDKLVYREFLIDLYTESKNYFALNEQLNYFINSAGYHEEYYYQLAKNYGNLGRFDDALEILDKLEKRIGYQQEIGKAKVRIYQKDGNKKKLLKEIDKLSRKFPDDLDLLLHQAVILDSVNESGMATDLYEQILKVDPDHVAANVRTVSRKVYSAPDRDIRPILEPLFRNPRFPADEKVKLLIPLIPSMESGSKQTQDMVFLAGILQELHADNPRVQALTGDVYFNAGMPAASIEYYQRTLDLDKRVFLVWKNLMIAQDHEAQYDALRKTAESAINYFPNQGVCYYYAGKSCLEMGLVSEGLDWLQEGFFMASTNPRLQAEFHLLMAFGKLQQGDQEAARSYFERIPEGMLGADHALFEEVRGDLFFSGGNEQEALSAWQKALKSGGRENRLRGKIQRLTN